MRDIRRLISYLGPYRKDMVLGALFIIVESFFELVIPVLIADLIDVGVIGRDVDYIFQKGIQMGICALLALITGLLYARFAARAAYGWGAKIREAEYERMQKYAFANLDHFETSSLITRMTTDVTVLQNAVNGGFRPLVRGPVMLIMGVALSFWMNARLALIFVVCAPVLGIILFFIVRKVAPMYGRLQRVVDRLNNTVQEGLTAIRAVKAFVRGSYEEEKFQCVNQELTDTSRRTFHFAVMNLPAFQLIMYVEMCIRDRQVGSMMAFIQYTMQIIMAFLMIAMVAVFMPRASVSASRVNEVLETEPSIRNPESAETPDPERRGELEFRSVSFAYPGAEEDVLTDVSFTARRGETVAFIGSTGSGKSTLVNLIPRFFDVSKGEILLDGVDIRRMDLKDLRSRLGYVPQKAVLFSGTIDSNLRYGREDAPEEEIRKAVEIAQAADFVDEKPEGIASAIAQGGSNVSGGQKQRLSIARAVVKQPEIYIFDDSFSALDFQTDARLRKALKRETADATSLIVAQRVSTILHADRILVLDEGRVVGQGTHKELLESCEVYRQIARSQLSEEELGA